MPDHSPQRQPRWLALVSFRYTGGDDHRWLGRAWVRSLLLILATLLLILIFSAPALRVREPLTPYSELPGVAQPSDAKSLAVEEFRKAIDEIKMNSEEGDAWFHYKFVLVGGLLAAFLAHILLPGGSRPGARTDDRVRLLLASSATCFVLALACVIAIAIDIHVRTGVTTTNQLGLWIANYVEPTINPPSQKAVTVENCPSDDILKEHLPNRTSCDGKLLTFTGFMTDEEHEQLANLFPGSRDKDAVGTLRKLSREQFLGWEQSLRKTGAMHTDLLYSFSVWPPLHFLTWVIYVMYLGVLQTVCLRARGNWRGQRWLVCSGFVLVHVCIITFAWTAHAAPSGFEFQLIPGCSMCWRSGLMPPASYLIPAFLLTLVNLGYLL